MIYQGPLSKTLVLLKRVSAFTLGISLSSSTLVHYCCSPYVVKMDKIQPESFDLTTLSLLGNQIKTSIKISDIVPHNQGFSNWTLKPGVQSHTKSITFPQWLPIVSRKRFYLHVDLPEANEEFKEIIKQVNANARSDFSTPAISKVDWNEKVNDLKKQASAS
jgi:hypothetical protein